MILPLDFSLPDFAEMAERAPGAALSLLTVEGDAVRALFYPTERSEHRPAPTITCWACLDQLSDITQRDAACSASTSALTYSEAVPVERLNAVQL